MKKFRRTAEIDFKELIKKLMDADVSQTQMARMIGVDQSTLSCIVHRNQNPSHSRGEGLIQIYRWRFGPNKKIPTIKADE